MASTHPVFGASVFGVAAKSTLVGTTGEINLGRDHEINLGRDHGKMIKENERRSSAKSDVRIEKDGRLFLRDKVVDVGMRVGTLGPVLRWHDWIVALGTSADPAQRTIKGSFWYLLWFGEKSLKGSHRQVVTVGMPLLRIYSN